MEYDKITPMSAPPGHSLTGTPGKWPWENPPQFANADDAIDFVVEKLEEPTRKEDVMLLMAAGISVQELVAQISFNGFMQGFYSPDVAELIKPAIGAYLYSEAKDNDIDVRLFIRDEDERGEVKGKVNEETFFGVMKERNPEMFADMVEYINRQQRMDIERERRIADRGTAEQGPQTPPVPTSFMGVN